MTGFAREEAEFGPYAWYWEVKSVNGKGLDMRCRLPNGMDSIEPELRRRISDRFSRGNFQVTLYVTRQAGEADIRLNEDVFGKVMEYIGVISKKSNMAPPSADGILSLRGVLELSEPDETEEERSNRMQALLASLDSALSNLAQARRKEGALLLKVLNSALDEIAELATIARETTAAQPDELRTRLKAQVEELLEASSTLSEERLSQEAAILMTKADVREEIDRLVAHVTAAKELLRDSKPVGRRLDFLMQELNREANTLCAKAADVELTRIGLDLKATIDQVREQVQNVE